MYITRKGEKIMKLLSKNFEVILKNVSIEGCYAYLKAFPGIYWLEDEKGNRSFF
jgi:hypothetical protein